MPKGRAEYGSDSLVDLLKSMDIKYASLNPGASVRGLHDSIVNYGHNKNPELVLCCHEGIAVSVASGYFRATGKPMVVLLHDLEGLLHATKAVFEAWLERESMILLGGNGPVDVTKRRPGIDWIHTALVPNLAVRDFVKWDDMPEGLTSALEALIRAYRVSTSEPTGPVYLALDAEMQEEKLKERPPPHRVDAYPTVTVGEGSISALKETSRMLINAEAPVILVDRYGTDGSAVANLVRLAEKVAAAVLDTGSRFSFPSRHPLNLSGMNEEVLNGADVVVTLGVKDLYYAIAKESKGHFERQSELMVRPGCKVVRVDLETIALNSWVNEYGRLTGSTLTVAAHPPVAVLRLLELCDKLPVAQKRKKGIEERRKTLHERSDRARRDWNDAARKRLGESPIAVPALALATWELAKDEDWVLAYPYYSGGGINTWIRRTWDITRFDQYPGRGGGTGTGIGRAIGAALGNKGRLCIDFQPDGDLLYSASSLWTAASYRVPLLILVLNNHSYYNDEEHQKAIALERGRPVENAGIGIRVENPIVDFSSLARSYGVKARGPCRTIADLKEAMKEGVREVTKKHVPYLLDLYTQPR